MRRPFSLPVAMVAAKNRTNSAPARWRQGSNATSVLSDKSIREEIESGRLVIDPWDENVPAARQRGPAPGTRVPRLSQLPPALHRRKEEMAELTELVSIDDIVPFILHPDEFVLAVTRERVEVPDDLVGRLDGKSSLGRLGLIVHSTAGFVDPGFKGRLTLELRNIANLPITLYYDMPVSQISFVRLTTPSEKPYGSDGSKYQGQEGPQASRYYLNYRQLPPGKPHGRRRSGK